MSESELSIHRVGDYYFNTTRPNEHCSICENEEYADVLIDGICGKCLIKEHDQNTSLRAENTHLLKLVEDAVTWHEGEDSPHAQLEQKIESLRALLKESEWVSFDYDKQRNFCWCCKKYDETTWSKVIHEHAPDCRLAKALEEE